MPNSGADIFRSMEFVNNLQRKFYKTEDDLTLSLSTFGSEAELFGRVLQNSIRIAAETSNESIPIKAKYDKNIIAHAYYVGIEKLEAVPAYMTIQLYIPKTQVDSKLIGDKFVFDKNVNIIIGEYEFHTDYDIIIRRNKIGPDKFVYTALYDIDKPNPISDITEPYLPPVGIFNTSSGQMIGISCVIRQVKHVPVYYKTISDDPIENKTFTFKFSEDPTDQLASFDIVATEGSRVYNITPVYDGSIDTSKEYYCEYQYIDTHTIRLKYNRDSYLPGINANITINLKVTKGYAGNFTFNDDVIVSMTSDKYNYNGMYALVKPVTNSDYGIDKKTIEEIKAEIPREALSRGSIVSTADLDNFFNSRNTESSKLYFYKKRYNMIDFIYYAYILMKYNNNVIPTNTIDIKVSLDDLEFNGSSYIINPLTTFVYKNGVGTISQTEVIEDANNDFVYVNPFMIVINKNPLLVSHYLNIFSTQKFLEFSYINQTSQLQFISSYISIKRSAYTNRNKYILNIDLLQNINEDFGIIKYAEDNTTVAEENMKVFIVFYSDNDVTIPYRYVQASLKEHDREMFMVNYGFELITDDTITSANKIKISNLLQPETGDSVDSYLSNGVSATLYILAKFDKQYGTDGIEAHIPGLEGYSLCNKYKIRDGLDFFYNYSQMMTSTPFLSKDGEAISAEISKIPMVRKQYLINDEVKTIALIKEIEKRRQYLEYCLTVLEDGFDIDFKFFNTYGPSVRFVAKDGSLIDRVNLSLHFEMKLYSTADKYLKDVIIQDIKSKVEDINSISELHMANLITEIKETYGDQLQYFEFLGFNEYGPGCQYIKNLDTELYQTVPEFLNINTLEDGSPDINITVI